MGDDGDSRAVSDPVLNTGKDVAALALKLQQLEEKQRKICGRFDNMERKMEEFLSKGYGQPRRQKPSR